MKGVSNGNTALDRPLNSSRNNDPHPHMTSPLLLPRTVCAVSSHVDRLRNRCLKHVVLVAVDVLVFFFAMLVALEGGLDVILEV